jgi:hypothetical protein
MRREGMQAQMIPTLISMVDHLDSSKNSQVGFAVPSLSVATSRRILITVTL